MFAPDVIAAILMSPYKRIFVNFFFLGIPTWLPWPLLFESHGTEWKHSIKHTLNTGNTLEFCLCEKNRQCFLLSLYSSVIQSLRNNLFHLCMKNITDEILNTNEKSIVSEIKLQLNFFNTDIKKTEQSVRNIEVGIVWIFGNLWEQENCP